MGWYDVIWHDMVYYIILSHLCHVIMLHNSDISSMTIVISSLYLIYWTWSVYTHNYDMA